MGKSNSTQPTHSTIGVTDPKPPRSRGRSKTVSRQRGPLHRSAKPSSPTANQRAPQRHPSPSPLITSLSSEQGPVAKEFTSSSPTSPVSSIEEEEVRVESEEEEEEEEEYYDACEEFSEQHKPVLANVQQVHDIIPSPEYDGAAKGRADVSRRARPGPSSLAQPNSTPATDNNFNSLVFGFSPANVRGPAKPAATPEGPPTVSPAAQQAQKAVPPPWNFPSRRQPVKKALLVGINYKDMSEDRRLYYAVRDAELWQTTLLGKGILPENIRTLTDGMPDGQAPTLDVLINHIRWLVQGAWAGDTLVFVFSGHAVHTPCGPSIVTADHKMLYRPILERELVQSVPAGVDLQIVFDCCHSAGMLNMQYCVGRMNISAPASDTHVESPTVCSSECEPSESVDPVRPTDTTLPRSPSPFSHSPQHGSLRGLPAVSDTATPEPPPVTPPMIGQETFGAPPQRHPRGGGGIAAAPPPKANAAAGSQPGMAAGVVSYLGSLVGIGSASTPAPVQTAAPNQAPAESFDPAAARLHTQGSRRTRQTVVEGTRMPDYFEERKEGFVKTAAKVMVWAGTGEYQKAFESYGRARHGVVTKAMCAALEQVGTRRDLWSYLVQEIESENVKRSKRDASKAVNEQPSRNARIQHAELWVSQGDMFQPLRSAAPVLDQPII